MHKYFTLLIASRLFGRLPTGTLYILAGIAGWIACYVNCRGRRAVVRNLRQVAPHCSDAMRRDMARQIFVNVARFYADFLRAPHRDLMDMQRRNATFRGLDGLRSACNEGTGVVLTSFHYGTPETAFHLVNEIGIPAFALTEKLQPPRLCDLVHTMRNSRAPIFEPVGMSSIKKAVRMLRNGKVVAIMADRDLQGKGICVEFCGAPARMPTGAIELALKTGAIVIPVITRRVSKSHIEIEIGERLPLVRTGDKGSDIECNARRLLAVFERQLQQDPTQWLVLQPVWGTCDRNGDAKRHDSARAAAV